MFKISFMLFRQSLGKIHPHILRLSLLAKFDDVPQANGLVNQNNFNNF